ncbi:unnamed protein product [Fraxinus pennsylvanica]|uniref:SEP domain-containing protein n=1 Tax=Fraxinus pennsylvanica TaxID=56036 RepID=A0AAD2DQH7_9LAMI|nr:unnamed protein product [Fraxinus pennsylvanica]
MSVRDTPAQARMEVFASILGWRHSWYGGIFVCLHPCTETRGIVSVPQRLGARGEGTYGSHTRVLGEFFNHLQARGALLGPEDYSDNDGPLRRLDDPENAPFLESIRKSECPKELEPADRRSSVHINLVRKDKYCPEPEKRRTPFQGVGRTLGSRTNHCHSPQFNLGWQMS